VSPDASAKKTFNLRMNLNHPCKYVAWGAKGSFHGKFHTGTDLAATSDAYAPLYDAKITLNGQDRFQTKKGSWFNAVASYETAGSKPTAGLYIYPFALRSAEHQPSGQRKGQSGTRQCVPLVGDDDDDVVVRNAPCCVNPFLSSLNSPEEKPVSLPLPLRKKGAGSVVTPHPDGNNVTRSWAMRRAVPTCVFWQHTERLQRLHRCSAMMTTPSQVRVASRYSPPDADDKCVVIHNRRLAISPGLTTAH